VALIVAGVIVLYLGLRRTTPAVKP
jgi:hypothetical protein